MLNTNTVSTTIAFFNVTSQPTLQSPVSQPSHSRTFLFVRCLTILLILLFLVIVFIIGIAWLILHPICPDFALNSLSISNFTLSNSRVNADYDIEFSVNNPNKKVGLLIDHFHVSLSYKATNIVSKSWMEPALTLQKMSRRSLSPRLPKDLSGQLVNKQAFKYMINDYWSKRVLNLNVEMKIRTRFMSKIWTTKEQRMKVSCKNLNVDFLAADGSVTGTGKLKGGGEKCEVDFV